MSFPVRNSDVEGQHQLSRVTTVQLSKVRVCLAVLLSFITCFIFALALKYSRKVYNRFLFSECSDEAICTHFIIESLEGEEYICKKRFLAGQAYFKFRMLKYRYNSQQRYYEVIQFNIDGQLIKDMIEERNTQTRDIKQKLYGPCSLKIPIDSIFIYCFSAFTGPFNILQYCAVAIWFAEKTVLQPVLILVFTVVAIFLNYLLYLRSRKKLQHLANIHQTVEILENNQKKSISSQDLLPGDLLVLQENQTVNCDCAIISGNVMVNEVTLTGEGIPISKSQLPNQNTEFIFEQMNAHCLFEGTKIIQINHTTENIAIVLRTGFSSVRGQYFRNVLFPNPQSLEFYIQAAKFILEIALIIGIIYAFLLIKYIPMKFDASLLVLRFLDNIVWSIPPSMPIFFQICKAASLVRLELKGVIGNNSNKVEAAGKIDTCCFDKTGTLTTLGFKCIKAFPQENIDQLNQIMGCCHHLVQINGEIMGDPLEIEMLNFSGFQYDFTHKIVTGNNQQFKIEKIFDFSSEKAMMSVIVTDGTKYYLFAKGSPESIQHLSSNKRDDLNEEVTSNALCGYRVLALAYKEIQQSQINFQREQLEEQLNYSGILVMENPLKSDTFQVIQTLKNTGLDIKIISGDNALTTLQCGKNIGLIDQDSQILVLDYNPLKQEIIAQQQSSIKSIDELLLEKVITETSEFAITGKFLDFITNKQKQYVLKTSSSALTRSPQKEKIFTEINQIDIDDGGFGVIASQLLRKTRIFARQKPEQKKLVVQLLQQLGRKVLMCGDGANDCSAISQAEVGISFSEADASYTSPFSSKTQSLMCVVNVLLQGKAAIMTIIEVFQYQISVNALKFIAVLFTFLEAETFADFQFTYTSIISNIPLLIFLCLSGPSDTLTKCNPLDNQFAYQNQIQIYNNLIWGAVGLIVNFFISQASRDVHTCNSFEPIDQCIPKPIHELKKTGDIQAVMFMSLMYFFMTFAINLYVSKPFKQRYFRNYILLLWTTICFVLFFVAAIFPQGGKWAKIINVNDNTFKGYNWIVIAVVIGTSLIGFITQEVIQRYFPSQKQIGQ